ncbi:DUF1643 domain-containing protein [Lactococcus lactis]|uniref:DUF1643 domain-containing protein n=1 Tax=Lactococcus lactis TaxID=1358 RepID=UPI002416A9AA|nr:DUF1643 domain-containing protein [Lactococcus lactis]MDG4957323.1 DUF1643 domain-containing protein [Lactococcus lactis]
MVAYPDYIDIRKIGINRTGLTTGENCRYSLTINLGSTSGTLVFILMNPSAATESVSDVTVNNCIEYARNNNYSKVIVLNLFPFYFSEGEKLDNFLNEKSSNNLEIYLDRNMKEIKWILKNEANTSHEIILGTGWTWTNINEVKKVFTEQAQKLYKILQSKTVYAFKKENEYFTNSGVSCNFTYHLGGIRSTKLENEKKFEIKIECINNEYQLLSNDILSQ